MATSVQDMQNRVGSWFRDDWDQFVQNYTPLLEEQLASLDDNSMVQTALDDSGTTAKRVADMSARAGARSGLGMDATQRRALDKAQSLGVRKNIATNVNNSRLDQRDRNENTAINLATQGNMIRNMAMDNMMQAVGLGTSRNNQNAMNRQNARSANMGTATALASAAIMAM